jgi:hypothetical protein
MLFAFFCVFLENLLAGRDLGAWLRAELLTAY